MNIYTYYRLSGYWKSVKKFFRRKPKNDGLLKIYLDDIRATPDGWHHCYKIDEVKRLLQTRVVTNMSLDHDLGASYLCPDCYDLATDWRECSETGCYCKCHSVPFVEAPSGYDLVKWMAEEDMWSVYKPTVHSANPAGRVNMQSVIDRYWHPPKNGK